MHKDRLGFQCRSHPVPAVRLRDTWGSPGQSVPSILSVPPTLTWPWQVPQPCRKQPALPCLCSLSNRDGQSFHLGYAPMGTFQHCFFFDDLLIG